MPGQAATLALGEWDEFSLRKVRVSLVHHNQRHYVPLVYGEYAYEINTKFPIWTYFLQKNMHHYIPVDLLLLTLSL